MRYSARIIIVIIKAYSACFTKRWGKMKVLPYRVRDPIHGFITFSENEKKIIDSKQFQRLKNIKQLSMTYYVYPGAMHTRFEHSLGVMELASTIFNRLYRKNADIIDSNFKRISLEPLEAYWILRLTALLHDIGHLPFSHGGEAILPKGVQHEDISIAIIKTYRDFLDKLYFEGISDIVVQILEGQVIPELNFLKDILSGSIDADRMDYLLRDSLHCGVNYGSFDFHRLIDTLTIIPDGTGGLSLAVDHGGIHSIEALILARYYMFTQVYMHRTRRIYDIYLKDFMHNWNMDLELLINVLDYDDRDLLHMLKTVAMNKEHESYTIANRICYRQHHSVVYETSEFADARDVKIAKKIFSSLKSENLDYDFILDDKAKGNIHNFFVPGDSDNGVELMVVHKQRKTLITQASSILGKIPKRFQVVRIYVNEKDQDELDRLRNEAKRMEKEVI